jgi:hypothetical protein
MKGVADATPEDLERGKTRRYTSPIAKSDMRVTNSVVVAVWLEGAYARGVIQNTQAI